MKKLSFLPILLLAVLLMVGCNEENKKGTRKENKKERRYKPISSKKSKKGHKKDGETSLSRELIEEGLIEARKDFPMQADEGITVVDANIEGNYVIYDAFCDESILSIDALNSNKKEVKQLLKSNLSDESNPDVLLFVSTCKKANLGIGYRYKGDTTGKICLVKLSPSEL